MPRRIAPPDPEVQREILRLELEAEVANLQAEADALLSEAVVEGRVVEVPEGDPPLELDPAADGETETPVADEPAADATAADASRRPTRSPPARPLPTRPPRLRPPTDATAADASPADSTPRTAAPPATPPSTGLSHRPTGPAYPAPVPDRLPPPGPSFLREHPVRIGDRTFRAGMARPSDAPDGWWLAVLWVADDDGVVSFRDVAPAAGPPPDPPLARLGPAISGALSGLILEDDGRLQMRLGLVAPPDDPTRPWRVPLGDPGGLPVRAGAGGDDAPERARGDGPRRVRPGGRRACARP